MAVPLLMPALSPTMVAGNLAKWIKKEGDKIKPGDVIAEIETDKATMEVEAVDSGILGKIMVVAGTEGVAVNQLIAVILEEGDKPNAVEDIIAANSLASKKAQVPQAMVQPTVSQDIANATSSAERLFASPLAKRIAMQERIDLESVQGSGPHGRIVKRDIIAAIESTKIPSSSLGRITPQQVTVPLSNMRKVIAKRLLEAKQTIPHFYLTLDCQIDHLLEARSMANQSSPLAQDKQPEYKLSVNDFVIKAVASALRAVPEANTAWGGDSILQFTNVDIAVAMAIADGLITPIIQNADQKSLQHISTEVKALNFKAKSGTLRPEEFQGGSFTITNLGMYGIKQFNAILNPPQACILAVGAAEARPIVAKGAIVIANVMTLTLSCDHRVVDGAVAARFMDSIKQRLENPVLMLV